jgi:hypothetical protein
MANTDDEEYEVPLRDQRYFGAGIKRRRVQFVSSSSAESTVQSLPTTPGLSASDQYLSIVFNKRQPTERAASAPPSATDAETSAEGDANKDTATQPVECEICHKPVTDEESKLVHDSSIAHQICLKHSHPPSHLDRRRRGLAVLESYGWDVDGRRGLGVGEGGILYPIKAKENPDRAGLGLDLTKIKKVDVVKAPKLDAGKVRAKEKENKKRASQLRDAFYRTDDMEKYLGREGDVNPSLDVDAFKRARRN